MKLFEIPIYYRTREESNKGHHWRCYDYNEVVGWIAFYLRKNAIRAEYWFVRQRPTRVLTRKEFEYMGKLFQVGVKSLNNAQIHEQLEKALKEFQDNSNLSKYHFDAESFMNTGKYIDWNKILNSGNS